MQRANGLGDVAVITVYQVLHAPEQRARVLQHLFHLGEVFRQRLADRIDRDIRVGHGGVEIRQQRARRPDHGGDPFRDLRSLQEEVNRLFSTNLTRGFGEEGIGRGAWNPSVDIYENKDQIILEAELPGMNRGDFELTVENNVITLRGERNFEKKDDTDNYHRVERSYGSFTRSFTLPQTVSAEGATA